MGTYTAKTRSIGHRPRSKRLRELGGTVVRQIEGGEGGIADLSGCELLSNKVTAVTAESTDEQYPTAKLLFDLYTAIGLTLQALQNDKANTAYVDTQLGSLTSSIASIAGALQGKADASHSHLIADLTDAYALFTQFALSSGVVSLTIGGQQRSITLPTAATPSGDPMHYVYVKLGCSYNAQTGLWTYRDLDDLTTEQVNNAYVFTAFERNSLNKTNLYRSAPVRFNFAMDGVLQDNLQITPYRLFQGNPNVECAYLASPSGNSYITLAGGNNGQPFYNCANLRKVGNTFTINNLHQTADGRGTVFFNCKKLEYLRYWGINKSFWLHTNQSLTLESVVYLIVNSGNQSAISIYLHADAMARCAADTTEYTYQGNTYTGIVALAAARSITLTDVLPS